MRHFLKVISIILWLLCILFHVFFICLCIEGTITDYLYSEVVDTNSVLSKSNPSLPMDESHFIDADTCPKCGSSDILKLRRVTGYLSSDYRHFNKGKQDEVEDRVKHINNEL